MPFQVPGTEGEGQTPTSASADEAASASRQRPGDPVDQNQLSEGRMDGAEGRKRRENKPGPKKLSTGRVAPTIIPLLCWEGPQLSVASVHWVEGVSHPHAPEKDRPSNRKLSNSIPRWLPIGRTPRLCARVAHWAQNDAYPYLAPGQNEMLRERAEHGQCREQSVVIGVVDAKILAIKITLQRMNIQVPLDSGRDPNWKHTLTDITEL